MKDFTLASYRNYIKALKASGYSFLKFQDYLANDYKTTNNICLIRHDVDRLPSRALQMAQLENDLEVASTYYFRTKYFTFDIDTIQRIEGMGHEIGYHYETLSDTNGELAAAFELFQNELEKLRNVANVTTCAMHGRPLSPYDNRELWNHNDYHKKLCNELDMLGEVYIDIDYRNILYLSDTGRNWHTEQNNFRDQVNSDITINFDSGSELLSYFQNQPHSPIILQVHPERWSSTWYQYIYNTTFDHLVNTAKKILRIIR